VAARVVAARRRAAERGVPVNAALPAPALDAVAPLDRTATRLLEDRLRRGVLSARGLHRVRRVALTMADLAGRRPPLGEDDICLALSLRAEPQALGTAA
jgi:magnesium chelatase family protein